MIRPTNFNTYEEVDLKLGIKSSLPKVKSTLALLILLWESEDKPSEVQYGISNNSGIIIDPEIQSRLIGICNRYYIGSNISEDSFIQKVNENPLFKSQLEALIVGFELIWKVAKIRFSNNMAASSERTGGQRYVKTINFTKNMDIIDLLISPDKDSYMMVLLKWLGLDVEYDKTYEDNLIRLFMLLSEEAIYKTVDGRNPILFNLNSVYNLLAEGNAEVDINGSEEAKGALRILKSSLSEGLNSYLSYNSGKVTVNSQDLAKLKEYQRRLESYLSICNVKYFVSEKSQVETVCEESQEYVESKTNRETGGENILLYGVPGAGKSHTIKKDYCSNENYIERVVFHPDYTYSDFVGQILPRVDGGLKYVFTPGPFTKMLKKAENDPTHKYYLIIEEINRGNAPAIFGEIFQLLDRKDEDGGYSASEIGESEYGISNYDVAVEVYEDEKHQVKIPSNLSIIATMNTSDQNIFTLDTAFQRRWDMRHIKNDVFAATHAKEKIEGTNVSWGAFASVINEMVIENSIDMVSSDDKRLGAYFVKKKELVSNKFSEKVLKYLWDDAFKMEKDLVFKEGYKSLESIIMAYESSTGDRLLTVLKLGVYEKMLAKTQSIHEAVEE